MKSLIIQIIRWAVYVLAQGLILGQLYFGYGIHPMICVLFILMLPFNTRPIILILIAFFTGIGVDFFMNTFGLHASALVLIAYLRPLIFKRFAPRDGYDLTLQPTANELGFKWFLKVASTMILIHHFWFFLLEYFKIDAWKEIIINTLLSSCVSLFIFILIQFIFFSKQKRV